MIGAKENMKNSSTREGSPISQKTDIIFKRSSDEISSIKYLEHTSKLTKISPLRTKPEIIERLEGPIKVLVNVATQTDPKHKGIILCSLAQHKEMWRRGLTYNFNHTENKLAVALSTIYFTESTIISSTNNALKVLCRKEKIGTPTDTLNRNNCVRHMGTQTNRISTNIRDFITNKRAFHKLRIDNLYFDKMIRNPPYISEVESTEIESNNFWGFVSPPPGFPVYFRKLGKRQQATIYHENCLSHDEGMKAIQEYKLNYIPSNYSELYKMVLLEKIKLSTCLNTIVSMREKEPKSSLG